MSQSLGVCNKVRSAICGRLQLNSFDLNNKPQRVNSITTCSLLVSFSKVGERGLGSDSFQRQLVISESSASYYPPYDKRLARASLERAHAYDLYLKTCSRRMWTSFLLDRLLMSTVLYCGLGQNSFGLPKARHKVHRRNTMASHSIYVTTTQEGSRPCPWWSSPFHLVATPPSFRCVSSYSCSVILDFDFQTQLMIIDWSWDGPQLDEWGWSFRLY